MATQPVERLERYPATLEEYLALPEGVRAEYVDGEVLVTPPPQYGHNQVLLRLLRLLDDHMVDVEVAFEPGYQTSETRYRVPDLVVIAHDQPGDTPWLTGTPLLVVEVLSPSTRSEDMLRKTPEYLAAGVDQYWIVDRLDRSLTVLVANRTHEPPTWDIAVTLDPASPTGEVHVGDHGTVPLDLGAIMPE